MYSIIPLIGVYLCLLNIKAIYPFLIPGNEANGKSVTKREMS